MERQELDGTRVRVDSIEGIENMKEAVGAVAVLQSDDWAEGGDLVEGRVPRDEVGDG